MPKMFLNSQGSQHYQVWFWKQPTRSSARIILNRTETYRKKKTLLKQTHVKKHIFKGMRSRCHQI